MLHTLGGLSLEGVDFHRPKALLLLAYLALERPRERQHLAQLFWPFKDNAFSNLNMTLYRLRKKIPEAVQTDNGHVWSELECDVKRLESALEQNRLEEVVTLYQGAFLEGLRFRGVSCELEEWVYDKREFYANIQRETFLRLAEQEALLENYRLAAKHAEAAFAVRWTPPLDSHDLKRLYLLLRAGESPIVPKIIEEARTLDIAPMLGPKDARKRLRERLTKIEIPNNLPRSATTFVGRESELRDVTEQLMQDDCVLLTLVGAGGVGKSRLALSTAHEQLGKPNFPDGVFYVELAAATTVQNITSYISDALGLELKGVSDKQNQLNHYLRDKRILLVLDNFEHLIEGAGIVTNLLRHSPRLKVMVTSRERLNLEAEHIFLVTGLSFPDRQARSAEQLEGYDAVCLFVKRARRVRPNFVLSSDNQAAIAHICQLVEGSPLGIELAAAWVRAVACQDIATEIEWGLDFLSSAAADIPERHHSLRATFEHSWRLLTPKAQTLLAKLSVFRGGFTREAASAIANANYSLLAGLVDKSLLRRSLGNRYTFHPLIAEYTREKLAEHPEQQARVQEKHGSYYLLLIRSQAEALRTQERKKILELIEDEIANLRTAWAWALARLRLELIKESAIALNRMLEHRNHEGLQLFAQAAEHLDETNPSHHAALGYVLLSQARCQYFVADPVRAQRLAQRSVELLRSVGDRPGLMRALLRLGLTARTNGEFGFAKTVFQEGLELARLHGTPTDIGDFLIGQAVAESEISDFSQARAFMQEVLEELRALGNLKNVAVLLSIYGICLVHNRLPLEGQELLLKSLELFKKQGFQRQLAGLYKDLAYASYHLTNYNRASRYAKLALGKATESGSTIATAQALAILAKVVLAQGNREQARHYLVESLKISSAGKFTQSTLPTLVYFAELQAVGRKVSRAVEYLSFVVTHSTLEKHVRAEAGQLLESLRENLTEQDFSAAQRRGQTLKLEEVVTTILFDAVNGMNSPQLVT